jgi:copper homeostasis protein (lipoprotein)
MRTPLVLLALLPLVALAALAACARPGTPGPDVPLEGTRWNLVEVGGRSVTSAGGERDAHLVFSADSARVAGSTGCNRLTGPFTRDGRMLRFGPTATTRMACLDQGRSALEEAFLEALRATTRFELAAGTLTLLGATGPVARLTAVRAP